LHGLANHPILFGILLQIEWSWFLNIFLSGDLKNVADNDTELLVRSYFISGDSVSEILHDRLTVHFDVIVNDSHVLERVGSDVNRLVESVEIEGFRVDSLADWKALLELLDESDKANDSTDYIRDILLLPG